MIKIVVTRPEVKELKGIGRESGKPYHIRTQVAHAYTQDPEGNVLELPDKFELFLDPDQAPFPRGQYTLHPSAIYVNREGRLSITPRLAPVAPATK